MINKRGAPQLTTYQKARLQVVGYRAIQTEVIELLSQYELNTTQWIILGWLYDNPAGMRITAVAEVLEVEVPLITALMQPLQRNRLISLKPDPTDKRAKLATLTKAGVALVAKLEPAMAAQLAVFDNSIKSSEMDSYFNALQNFIYASNRRKS
jgi:DNA-binding MarR family transcriptional regulator